MSEAVRKILEQVQKLPEEDRLTLEEGIAQLVGACPTQSMNGQPGYSLRGSVIRYDNPTAPIADDDWEALR
jgi:hypothetical protein